MLRLHAVGGTTKIVCALMVTKSDRVAARIFSRRSRWAYANPGGPGLTRKPIPEDT